MIRTLGYCLVVLVALCAVGLRAGAAEESYASLVDEAMARMHAAMAKPGTGDPDRDFAAMMIPHHQGAIEMAEAELRFGRDPVLRRLAQGIVVEQQQEIAVMQQALAALPPATPTPSASSGASSSHGHH